MSLYALIRVNNSDAQLEKWTQVLSLRIGAFNHSATAARARTWLKSSNKLRYHKFWVHLPQTTWRSAFKIAGTELHV